MSVFLAERAKRERESKRLKTVVFFIVMATQQG